MESYIWWGVAGAVLVLSWYLKRPDLTAAKARELVANGALLVDVRSPGEFSSGHIKGAKNIPVDALAKRTNELGAKERAVVLYCASGARSAMAKRQLVAAGFSQVHNLGSMRNWS